MISGMERLRDFKIELCDQVLVHNAERQLFAQAQAAVQPKCMRPRALAQLVGVPRPPRSNRESV